MRKLGGVLSLVLLVAAVVLFILAALPLRRLSRGWMVPAGLACFSGSFLAAQTL